ncbi:MAG: non-homologous end-joining DNA ligase [Solirubrobacterales bacterium]
MARDKLTEYERKRAFDRTPEPRGGAQAGGEGGRFVVQEHHASRLHWDLRLERDGVAVSWALPKGLPPHPKENRLAVHTEDHPLEYLTFEGEIPKGEYGAGTMSVWDHGTYEALEWHEGKVTVVLHGDRVEGTYGLFPTKGRNWMIHRMDPPADPGRVPMPERAKPMMAVLSELPREDGGWAYELKWDGVRAIGYSDAGHLKLESRNGRDITSQYPELRPLGSKLGALQVILDGEIVAFDADGRPDFQLLQRRMHLGSEAAVRRRATESPVTYVLFDVLFLEGRELYELPYADRRRLLADLGLDGPSWQTPAYHQGDGAGLLELTRQRGLEGVVVKRLDSRYTPGRRSRSWLKVKNTHSQDFVIGGWMPGEGRRSDWIGSLLVGFYEPEEGGPGEAGDVDRPLALRYAGRVGSGFTDETLRDLSSKLAKLRSETSPFSGRKTPKEAVFVEPALVAEVEFREWTAARTLRAPSFKGLRDDRDPAEVRFAPDAAPGVS